MKENSLCAIRSGFKEAVAELQELGPLQEELHWVYHRSPGGWEGELVPRPSFLSLARIPQLDKLSAPIEIALREDYPGYLLCVGTQLGGGPLQTASILPKLVYESYRRFGTIAPTNDQVESLLADLSAFFDRTTVRLRLYAPALNLHGASETRSIPFPGGFILRPISEEEVTQFYGGNPIFPSRHMSLGIPNFVFVKDVEIPKIIGSFDLIPGDSMLQPAREDLDRSMLALATFKDGAAVGYDGIHIVPDEFTLGIGFGPQHLGLNEHVPFGMYDLTQQEGLSLESHVKQFEGMHSTLEMASQRLVDSGRRTKPRDALVDGVIGLESILLANLGERNELRFRFSLHYAMLFAADERQESFRTAKDPYDVRSSVAHGSTIRDKVTINGKSLDLGEAAALARSILRKTISMFITSSKSPDFMKVGYWTSKVLGLS